MGLFLRRAGRHRFSKARENPTIVFFNEFVAKTESHPGADVEAVCCEAATIAVREHVRAEAEGEASDVDAIELTVDHFERAFEEISPDVGEFGDALKGAEGEA